MSASDPSLHTSKGPPFHQRSSSTGPQPPLHRTKSGHIENHHETALTGGAHFRRTPPQLRQTSPHPLSHRVPPREPQVRRSEPIFLLLTLSRLSAQVLPVHFPPRGKEAPLEAKEARTAPQISEKKLLFLHHSSSGTRLFESLPAASPPSRLTFPRFAFAQQPGACG